MWPSVETAAEGGERRGGVSAAPQGRPHVVASTCGRGHPARPIREGGSACSLRRLRLNRRDSSPGQSDGVRQTCYGHPLEMAEDLWWSALDCGRLSGVRLKEGRPRDPVLYDFLFFSSMLMFKKSILFLSCI